jgi:hypothetical protein
LTHFKALNSSAEEAKLTVVSAIKDRPTAALPQQQQQQFFLNGSKLLG